VGGPQGIGLCWPPQAGHARALGARCLPPLWLRPAGAHAPLRAAAGPTIPAAADKVVPGCYALALNEEPPSRLRVSGRPLGPGPGAAPPPPETPAARWSRRAAAAHPPGTPAANPPSCRTSWRTAACACRRGGDVTAWAAAAGGAALCGAAPGALSPASRRHGAPLSPVLRKPCNLHPGSMLAPHWPGDACCRGAGRGDERATRGGRCCALRGVLRDPESRPARRPSGPPPAAWGVPKRHSRTAHREVSANNRPARSLRGPLAAPRHGAGLGCQKAIRSSISQPCHRRSRCGTCRPARGARSCAARSAARKRRWSCPRRTAAPRPRPAAARAQRCADRAPTARRPPRAPRPPPAAARPARRTPSSTPRGSRSWRRPAPASSTPWWTCRRRSSAARRRSATRRRACRPAPTRRAAWSTTWRPQGRSPPGPRAAARA
jgi:hypothetical protein